MQQDNTEETTALMKRARVIAEHKTSYVIRADGKECKATLRGKFHLDEDFPKVGDFVEYTDVIGGPNDKNDLAVIEKILPRKTVIMRDMADRTRNAAVQKPQIIVTNVDVIFIVMGLDGDFNLRRLERYLVLAKQSGIKPVIVLNKSDLIEAKGESQAEYESQISAVAPSVPVHFLSALADTGMNALSGYFDAGITAVLLGSSGAGKSTITNRILGHDRQAVGEIREDDSRGRHTTTSRELFDLPSGGHLIDTPGMRSLGMLGASEEDEGTFEDIEALMLQCRYTGCDHEKSEGCAVMQAIADGTLDPKHYQSYKKIQKEKEYRAGKDDAGTRANRKDQVKKIHKAHGKIQNQKYRDRGFR